MSLTFEEASVDIPADDIPETTDDAHYCQEPGCTNEVFRNGTRGRWPKYCDEHKKGSATKSTTKRSTPGQAKQAAAVLGQINDMLALGLTVASGIPAVPLDLSNTASALATVNEGFVIQAEEALATDPALCRAILRVGKVGGKAALASAYLMMGVGLAPAIMADIQGMRKGGDKE